MKSHHANALKKIKTSLTMTISIVVILLIVGLLTQVQQGEKNLTKQETYEKESNTDYSLAETQNHSSDTVEPLTFPSDHQDTAESSMGNISMFFTEYSPNGYVDYWTLRQFIAGNIPAVSEHVGSNIVLSSVNNLGGDDKGVISDGVTACVFLLHSPKNYECSPI